MPIYRSGDVNKEGKTKLTPEKAIKKFIISYGVKLEDDVPVYYAWDNSRQPEWHNTKYGMYPDKAYITVDYDKIKREWYIGYIVAANDRLFATIDDLTGRCDLMAGE